MATPAYMSVTGENEEIITKDAFTLDSVGSDQQDHKDEVLIQAFDHEVIMPRDPQSGGSTGQRIHQPARVTKVFDRSSPLLHAALCRGQTLSEVVIKWFRTSKGKQEHYYTTKLEDAVIVNIRDYMHNCQDPENAHFTHLQDVYFAYRKITWTHEVSSTSGSDDWREPVTS